MDKTDKKDKKISERTPMDDAAKYLAARMRTVGEVRKHLSDKGYSTAEIDETVNELIGLRYLDDYQYALRYYEYNREKHRGSARAARELAEKGLDSETIRFAREDYIYTNSIDEFSDALEIALKEISAKISYDLFDNDGQPAADTVFDDKISARIARKLDGKGFERRDIYRVLDELRKRYD